MKRDEIAQWAERMRAKARQSFDEFGSLPPHAVFLATRHPDTGASLEFPMTVPFVPEGYDGSEFSKDALAEFLPHMANKLGAPAMVFFSEAKVLARRLRGDTDAEWRRDARRIHDAFQPGDVINHPASVDVVVANLSLLCEGKMELWLASVERKGARLTCGAFELQRGESTGGRFVYESPEPRN